jgi:protease II
LAFIRPQIAAFFFTFEVWLLEELLVTKRLKVNYMHNKIDELRDAADLLKIGYQILEQEDAKTFISETLTKFSPFKTSGHLSIGSTESTKISTDDNEFTFSSKLAAEPGYIFFEQDGTHSNLIFVLNNIQNLSAVLEECSGMEYFVTNERKEWIISVNWYTIEFKGIQYVI